MPGKTCAATAPCITHAGHGARAGGNSSVQRQLRSAGRACCGSIQLNSPLESAAIDQSSFPAALEGRHSRQVPAAQGPAPCSGPPADAVALEQSARPPGVGVVGGASAHEEFCDVLTPVVLQQLQVAAPSSSKAVRRQPGGAGTRSVVAWASAAGVCGGENVEGWVAAVTA